MEPLEIVLHRIDANPWNPRMSESGEHVKKLALSIARDGLMQPPVGRWVFPDGTPARGMGRADLTESGMRVQLAFGHSRLAAFRWLEDVKGSSNLAGDWSRMPVVIVEMSDEEMALKALAENMARKDLNAIEEARAMARLREEFGKTSAEIGEIFTLSDSAVRNKMRLLALPEFLQNALRQGELSEGSGRALIALYDIPEAARLEAEDGDELKPSEILEAARSGLAPARVAEMVSALAERLAPRPEQLSILVPPGINPRTMEESVSTETLEEKEPEAARLEAEEDAAADDERQMDLPATPLERMFAPVETPKSAPKPAPAPIPPAAKPQPANPGLKSGATQTEPKLEPKPESKPVPAQPAPTPAPAPEPAPAVTWEGSQILLSLTLWPEDSSGQRMVSIGGRIGQGAPRMALARLADIELPRQLVEMMDQLKGGL
jgi:ParB/RepB/Spo0J family partition protein